MLAQKGKPAALAPQIGPAAKTKPNAPASTGTAARKLSFKDKHALETLPKRIEQLSADIAKQRRILDDPKLYTRDRAGFTRATDALAAAEAALAAAEEQWLELELKREELGV